MENTKSIKDANGIRDTKECVECVGSGVRTAYTDEKGVEHVQECWTCGGEGKVMVTGERISDGRN